MRILHIGKYFPPYRGGMETYLRDLMLAQQRQGLTTQALVHSSNITFRNRREEFREDNASVSVTRAAVWLRLLFTPISPAFPWLLARLIRRDRPDILHLHLPNISATWALLLPAARRLPWVVHWHSDIPATSSSIGLRVFYRLYRPLERAMLAYSNAIIVTSPPYLASSDPLRPFQDKCHVVPLGLADRVAMPATVDDETPLRVLAVGRLTYYKGFEYLLRALARCDDVSLDLVGTGDCEQSLLALAQELGLAGRIRFHGPLAESELNSLYAQCHCVCLPSIERSEAFGLVLLEAMQHGRASIVTRVKGSGMTWVIEDGVSGLHAAARDSVDLAEAIQRLLACRDKLREMGLAARCRFDREFHIEKSAQKVTRIYRYVC